MVTGIETAGLVLASLPFFAKSLTQYKEGIETLSLFRKANYQREQRRWDAILSGQSAVLKHTIIKILYDIVDDDEEIPEMIADPRHERWKDAILDRRMHSRLGDKYVPIKANMMVVLESIEDIKRRLGPLTEEDAQDSHQTRIWVYKFKNVFSENIYDKLLGNINDANSLLQHLLEIRSQEQEGDENKLRSTGKFIRLFAIVRRHAASLHNILFREQKWTCRTSCHSHVINLRLDPLHVEGIINVLPHPIHKSTIAVLSQELKKDGSQGTLHVSWREHILEAEMIEMTKENHVLLSTNEGPKRYMTRRRALSVSPAPPPGKRQKTVAFDVSAPPHSDQSTRRLARPAGTSQIVDLCRAITALEAGVEDRKYLGFFLDRLSEDQQSDLYLVRTPDVIPSPRSLQEILQIAWEQKRDLKPLILSKPDCALVAVTLASNVLRLQGNWLRPSWGLQDIVLSELAHKGPGGRSPMYAVGSPYLMCPIPEQQAETLQLTAMNMVGTSETVHCPTLFPLGIALVELALCRPLARIPLHGASEVSETDPAALNLKIVQRVLPRVSEELGDTYRDVVFDCLWWPPKRPQDDDLDNIDFQKAVLQYVVLPLMDVWKILSDDRKMKY